MLDVQSISINRSGVDHTSLDATVTFAGNPVKLSVKITQAQAQQIAQLFTTIAQRDASAAAAKMGEQTNNLISGIMGGVTPAGR